MPPQHGSDSPGSRETGAPLDFAERVRLAALLGWDFLAVSLGLRLLRLAPLVKRLRRPPRLGISRLDPERLSRIVDRVLRLGSCRPRCLVLSLVLFRLLRRQGTPAELVIGLASDATSHEAHAWVEVDGEDVGPPPGRRGHEALARYGAGEPRAGG